jgi:hypothetical protein
MPYHILPRAAYQGISAMILANEASSSSLLLVQLLLAHIHYSANRRGRYKMLGRISMDWLTIL